MTTTAAIMSKLICLALSTILTDAGRDQAACVFMPFENTYFYISKHWQFSQFYF